MLVTVWWVSGCLVGADRQTVQTASVYNSRTVLISVFVQLPISHHSVRGALKVGGANIKALCCQDSADLRQFLGTGTDSVQDRRSGLADLRFLAANGLPTCARLIPFQGQQDGLLNGATDTV